MTMKLRAVINLLLLTCASWCVYCDDDLLMVNITLVQNASAQGAVCLDGSLPAYHLDSGFGDGASNWLLEFEGGGWCNDIKSCLERAQTRRGSSNYMNRTEVFAGILSNNASQNPDFYNWNRVKLRYCDGASFAGDGKFDNGINSYLANNGEYKRKVFFNIVGSDGKLGTKFPPISVSRFRFGTAEHSINTSLLYFRGQKIWQAIIHDLLPKGLGSAAKALLSGCSAGGLASFLHCDNFTSYLPSNASVKCMSDAGFFLNIKDISLNETIKSIYDDVVSLQGVQQNLNGNCTSSRNDPKQCFFPQYALPYIKTPFFVLNAAYDVWQFHNILVPSSADPGRNWSHCKQNLTACSSDQINILQGLRNNMLGALSVFYNSSNSGGMYINSCFVHCQSEQQDTWFAPDSPRLNNKTIAEAVGDWYFGRRETKEIDCAYPCDNTCHTKMS